MIITEKSTAVIFYGGHYTFFRCFYYSSSIYFHWGRPYRNREI